MSFDLVGLPEIDAVNWMTNTVEGVCNICGRECLSLEPISTIKAAVKCDVCEVSIAIVERASDG
jgi:hypothetical protein